LDHLVDTGPDLPTRRDNFEGRTLSAWQIAIDERAKSTILLQPNPSFGETLNEVHFGCRELC